MTPARSQPVVVRVPGEADLSARVDAVDARGWTLVLAVPPRGGVRRTPAVVEYVTPTGIHRIAGALDRAGGDPAVLRLAPSGEETVQRREWARVDAVVPVDVRCEQPVAAMTATVTLNLSGGGALIKDPIGVPLGTEVHLTLQLDGTTICASGRVVREAPDNVKGIEIDTIDDGDRERIVRFVADRQRAQMRIKRAGA